MFDASEQTRPARALQPTNAIASAPSPTTLEMFTGAWFVFSAHHSNLLSR